MLGPFSKAPLNLGSRVFRLVELQPSTEGEDIRCDLQTFSLDANYPEYVALSYAWGSKQSARHIVLDGKKCPVGDNLWWFLHHMQQQHRYIQYWIDAICIDQENVLERNHQVNLMRDIYSNAQSVTIWLGKASDDSNLTMNYLSRRRTSQRAHDSKKFWTPKQAKGVLALCERNYWRRIWIVQEVMLARQVTICCGSKNIPWNSFESLMTDLQLIVHRGREQHVPCASSVLASPAVVIGRAKSTWNGELQPLTRLLQLYQDHEATNLRDKVFALHGLANDSSDILIDYRISTKDLAIQILHHVRSSERCICANERMSSRELIRFGAMLGDMLRIYLPEEEVRFHVLETEHHASQCHNPFTVVSSTAPGANTPSWNESFMPENSAAFRRNYTDLNENWTKISDLAERRRTQNRIAQRNHRKKLKKRLEDLERRAASSSVSPPPYADRSHSPIGS